MSQISSRPSSTIRKLPSPVIGFRIWCIARLDEFYRPNPDLPFSLYPININYGIWHPGVNEAACKKLRYHSPAEPECHCGFWIKDSLGGAVAHRTKNFTVVGVAMGWGRVQIHEDGWRCQYATPLALAFDPIFNQGSAHLSEVAVGEALKQISLRFDVPLLGTTTELFDWYKANTTK